MPELETVENTPSPVTEARLLNDLRALGIARGDTLIVHTAMYKIGWVCGREVAVVRALIRAVGPTGMLVMPAHSGDNSEPSDWGNPPVPESWFTTIRESMPAYCRQETPSRCMGRVAECFRTYPGTRRSAHPHVSWCARGPGAAWLLRGHRFGRPCFGPQSPLGRLYRRNAKVLLLGVGYDNCTALHMAEALNPATPRQSAGAAVRVRGRRVWQSWREIEMDSDRFPQIGEAYELAGGEAIRGKVGNADCRVVRVKPLVDYGLAWLQTHPAEPSVPADAQP
ncbi:MAG TPA: AAC(3) family N-acetyltransferase [Candidatus Limiplasma sp.]|nr:AAC(3) family N-acetyltransferase [Candidatus Limiplasma sp.]